MSGFDDAATIGEWRTDHLYVHPFRTGDGKFFTVIIEDDGNRSVEYIPPFPSRNRLKIKFTFIAERNEITKIELRKYKEYKDGWREQWSGADDPISLTHFSFQKIMSLLQLMTELGLANVTERRLAIHDGPGPIEKETVEKVKSIMALPEGHKILDEVLQSGLIQSHDIVNIGYRKAQLAIFKRLLEEPAYLDAYKVEESLTTPQEEKIWQHFFQKNPWIFGFGLDYRYLNILQAEAHIADTDLNGNDAAIVDFLMGCTNFTVLVEVKKPSAPLFVRSQNRANSWRLSKDFIDAVSQILEQKASWQIKAETNAHKNFNADAELLRQRTLDPKCILIMSSSAAFAGSEKEREIKLRTFELFRRDTRNIEIVTFDELYERASFIVSDKVSAGGHTVPTDSADYPF
ncbi:Shedu immune nuclease family protein [Rhizobium leguminosarum]|uniref:Shedu immune nuclease family protein n=1 Tax=Rhizobium leguminosarum TaxID=384 RepID=UPI0021BBE8D9|nr:Shedu immune nuclease family protein [Rhizobium leguminosarum]